MDTESGINTGAKLPFELLEAMPDYRTVQGVLSPSEKAVRRDVLESVATEYVKLRGKVDELIEKKENDDTPRKYSATITVKEKSLESYMSFIEWLCGRIPGVFSTCSIILDSRRMFDEVIDGAESLLQHVYTGISVERFLAEFDTVSRMIELRTKKSVTFDTIYGEKMAEFHKLLTDGVMSGNDVIQAKDVSGISLNYAATRLWSPATVGNLKAWFCVKWYKEKWVEQVARSALKASGRKIELQSKPTLEMNLDLLVCLLNDTSTTWEKRELEKSFVDFPQLLDVMYGEILLPRHIVQHICQYFGQNKRRLLDSVGLLNSQFYLTVISLERCLTTTVAKLCYIPYHALKNCARLKLTGDLTPDTLRTVLTQVSPKYTLDLSEASMSTKNAGWEMFCIVLNRASSTLIGICMPRSSSVRSSGDIVLSDKSRILRGLAKLKALTFDMTWWIRAEMFDSPPLVCPLLETVTLVAPTGLQFYGNYALIPLERVLNAPSLKEVAVDGLEEFARDFQYYHAVMVAIANWAAMLKVPRFRIRRIKPEQVFDVLPVGLPIDAALLLFPTVENFVGFNSGKDWDTALRAAHRRDVSNVRVVEFPDKFGDTDVAMPPMQFLGPRFYPETPLHVVMRVAKEYFGFDVKCFPVLRKVVVGLSDWLDVGFIPSTLADRKLKEVCQFSRRVLNGILARELVAQLKNFDATHGKKDYDNYVTVLNSGVLLDFSSVINKGKIGLRISIRLDRERRRIALAKWAKVKEDRKKIAEQKKTNSPM